MITQPMSPEIAHPGSSQFRRIPGRIPANRRDSREFLGIPGTQCTRNSVGFHRDSPGIPANALAITKCNHKGLNPQPACQQDSTTRQCNHSTKWPYQAGMLISLGTVRVAVYDKAHSRVNNASSSHHHHHHYHHHRQRRRRRRRRLLPSSCP